MNTKHPFYRFIAGALTLLLILVLGYVALMVWVWSPAISDRDLAKFHTGMTKDDVISIMGKPRGIRTDKSGIEIWTYGRPLQWACFIVDFNTNGTVESFDHDE